MREQRLEVGRVTGHAAVPPRLIRPRSAIPLYQPACASRTRLARLVNPPGGPYLSLITEPREVHDEAQGHEAVPAAMLRQWRVGRRVEPRHDPGHQPGDRRDLGHGAADGC